MIEYDEIVSGLRHAEDRAVGRRLVIARRPEGWRLGYQVPHYGGATWRPADDPDYAQIPLGWSVAEWLGDPFDEFGDAAAVAVVIRARVLERVQDDGREPDALLPVVLDLGAPAAIVV